MVCGVINNNKACCPKCLGSGETIKILDVEVGMVDEEPHFEMIAKCRKCDIKFYYFLDTEMAERKAVDKKSDRYSKNTQDVMEEEFDE